MAFATQTNPTYQDPAGTSKGLLVDPHKYAAASIAILQDQLVLPQLFAKHSDGEFRGVQGDVINIKRPSWIVAQNPLTLRKTRGTDGAMTEKYKDSTLNEYTIPVKIDSDLYSSMKLSDEMLTLDVENFAGQVLEPQTRALAEKYEAIVHSYMTEGFTDKDLKGTKLEGKVLTGDADKDSAAIRKIILTIRKNLNDANVPATDRHLVVGSAVEEVLLQDSNLIRADWAGDSNALRQAQVGKIYGFTVSVVNTVGENEIFGFHSSALQLVSMAPATPQGAPFASSLGAAGLALRYIRDYDFANAQDRSLMNTYFGAGVVKDFKTAADQASYAADPSTNAAKLTQVRGYKVELAAAPKGDSQPVK